MRTVFIVIAVPFFLPGLICCIPLRDNRGFLSNDLHPPVLLGSTSSGAGSITVFFNETPEAETGNFRITPALQILEIVSLETNLVIRHTGKQTAGTEYILEGIVSDEAGNSLGFITRFYGFNPRVPDMLINEFTTQGSSTHPDMVELYTLSEGNMAGVCLYQGVHTEWKERIIFPPLEIDAGEYILVHFKPQGIPEEIDEIESKDRSGGLDASPEAWDFWVDLGSGLSGNNGVLSLYACPGGRLIDGVIYSNRTSTSDEKYRGFGTSTMLFQAESFAEEGGWASSGDLITPEDCINPDDSTATRSMNRGSIPEDTDTKYDWHIVPTSTYSFGGINSDEVFVP